MIQAASVPQLDSGSCRLLDTVLLQCSRSHNLGVKHTVPSANLGQTCTPAPSEGQEDRIRTLAKLSWPKNVIHSGIC